jgi:hypothetical protein
MTAAAILLVLLVATPIWGWTPVTILNPKHLPVPEEEVNRLFQTTCRVVAQEFHLQNEEALDFRLVLVMGERDEHVMADEDKGVYIVYLNRWNEGKFATSAMRLAVWRVVPRKRRDELVRNILLWWNSVEPAGKVR